MKTRPSDSAFILFVPHNTDNLRRSDTLNRPIAVLVSPPPGTCSRSSRTLSGRGPARNFEALNTIASEGRGNWEVSPSRPSYPRPKLRKTHNNVRCDTQSGRTGAERTRQLVVRHVEVRQIGKVAELPGEGAYRTTEIRFSSKRSARVLSPPRSILLRALKTFKLASLPSSLGNSPAEKVNVSKVRSRSYGCCADLSVSNPRGRVL